MDGEMQDLEAMVRFHHNVLQQIMLDAIHAKFGLNLKIDQNVLKAIEVLSQVMPCREAFTDVDDDDEITFDMIKEEYNECLPIAMPVIRYIVGEISENDQNYILAEGYEIQEIVQYDFDEIGLDDNDRRILTIFRIAVDC